MRAALVLSRRAAHRSEPLTVARVLGWQEVVLGRPAAFRTSDAFAKDGRERSPRSEGIPESLARWLDDALRPTDDVFEQAARSYLDLCFLHPFDNGNARAARLVLDYVLTRGSAPDEDGLPPRRSGG